VAFSPDGTKIISGSSDHTIRLWDAVTGVLLRVFSGHTGRIYSVAASPSGSMIVSGSDDNTIRIWDMATGALLRIFKDDFGKVLSIMCPAENAWVAVGTKYNDIVLSRWDSDMSDGVFLRTLHGHTIDVWCLSISANGELAVSGSLDRTVRVWHVESGALRATFEGHEDTISAVAFSPDGRRIISGSYDYTMRIWDMETSSLLLMRKLDHPVWSVIHLPLTNEAASGCNDTIYIWNATTSDPLRTLQSHDAACLSLAISQDGMCIASAGYTDKILIWQVEGNSSEPERFWRIDLVKFSPNGSRIVSATDSTLRIWDVSTGTLLRTLEDHPDNISTTSFSEDSAQLLTASGDTIIRLWDMDTGTLLKTFEGHGRDIASVGFIHGGTQIFSITWDRQIRVQDTATGIVIQTMQWEFLHNPHCTALFPNGGQIAVAMEDVIQVWDLAGGGLQKTLQGHSSMVTGITFSADGTQIVSCSSDGSVRLWHAVTGTEIKAFHIDGKIPDNWKVWFSSDQKSIFTNSELVTIPKEFLSIGSLENAGALTSIYDPGYFMSSGWLWTQQPRRRICWVPSGWRHRKDQISISDMFTWHGTNVAFGTLNGVVFIDTTDAVDYLKNFY
jgi:WD40 repeat protein